MVPTRVGRCGRTRRRPRRGGSKEGLLEAVVAAELGLQFAGIADPDPDERRRRLKEVLHSYLDDQHRADPASGCVMPRTERAWAMIASVVGAVTIARALPPGDHAHAVLKATLQAALQAIAVDH